GAIEIHATRTRRNLLTGSSARSRNSASQNGTPPRLPFIPTPLSRHLLCLSCGMPSNPLNPLKKLGSFDELIIATAIAVVCAFALVVLAARETPVDRR